MSLRRHSQRAVHVASDAFSNGRASMALHVPSDAFSIGRVSGPRQDAFSNGMWPASQWLRFLLWLQPEDKVPNSKFSSISLSSVRPTVHLLALRDVSRLSPSQCLSIKQLSWSRRLQNTHITIVLGRYVPSKGSHH